MNVQFDADEFWPWFNILKADDPLGNGKPVDVDDETLSRWRQELERARAVQDEIRRFVRWDQ